MKQVIFFTMSIILMAGANHKIYSWKEFIRKRKNEMNERSVYLWRNYSFLPFIKVTVFVRRLPFSQKTGKVTALFSTKIRV